MAGIECQFVEKPPKAFQTECPICMLVLREPYQATCCGKSFCKECIEQLKLRNHTCPTCKTENFFSYPNKGLEQSLCDFQVYCGHKSEGCEWTGELRELDKHLNSEPPTDKSLEGCPFTVINCPLSHTTGCEVRLPRKDVKIHVNEDLIGHLMKQMALVATLVTDNKIVKGEKDQLEQRVAQLEGEVKELKKALEVVVCSNQPIGPVEITMTHFQQCKRKNDQWYSLPFYTHPHGYKMCIRVIPNGFGRGNGTHLSVFIHLMRGEFDYHLKWPLRGHITIQLPNQEEDKDHVVKVIPFGDDTPDNVANRVTEGERNVSGRGIPEFLPHSKSKQGYLKTDCLKFCFTKLALP